MYTVVDASTTGTT
jgi:hypothetical protein